MEDINFCTMPQEKLEALLEFLGEGRTIKESDMIQTIVKGECTQKKWEWYNTLYVRPDVIISSDVTSVELMTAKKYIQMKNLFK
jgi:hypothetical protein